jgi:CubicO group peptidase (beta-lactamase class C family)
VALAIAVPGHSATKRRQPALDRTIDAYFQPYVANSDFSGSVLIARGEKILLEKSYGKADYELKAPFTAESRFHIASITKTFTAAAIEILAERGALSYEDHLSKWAPSFPSADAITVRHLLLHQSGVGNPEDSTERTRVPLQSVVDALGTKPLQFGPGTSSRYSNGGYLLLAFVVEQVSGTSWEDFLTKEIFKPLQLTSIRSDAAGAIITNRVNGYAPGPGQPPLVNVDSNMSGAIGGGSLLASARDLYRWGRAVRNETLVKRTKLEYPHGWGVRKYFGRNAIEQSGVSPGFTSYLAVYPDDDLYVVVLSNVETGLSDHSGIDVAAIALGEKYEPVKTPQPAAMSAEERRMFAGRFTNPRIGTFAISEDDGVLYVRWGNSPYRKYLMPVSSHTLFNRQEFSWIESNPAAPDVLSIRWGKDPQMFQRIVEAPR